LWGFCRTCEFAPRCRAGCAWTAHAFLGSTGNNPYCHHRALTLAASGQRERLVPVQSAPGEPFDSGRFELVLEPADAPWPYVDRAELTPTAAQWPTNPPLHAPIQTACDGRVWSLDRKAVTANDVAALLTAIRRRVLRRLKSRGLGVDAVRIRVLALNHGRRAPRCTRR
jgi:hypothetical protein